MTARVCADVIEGVCDADYQQRVGDMRPSYRVWELIDAYKVVERHLLPKSPDCNSDDCPMCAAEQRGPA